MVMDCYCETLVARIGTCFDGFLIPIDFGEIYCMHKMGQIYDGCFWCLIIVIVLLYPNLIELYSNGIFVLDYELD